MTSQKAPANRTFISAERAYRDLPPDVHDYKLSECLQIDTIKVTASVLRENTVFEAFMEITTN